MKFDFDEQSESLLVVGEPEIDSSDASSFSVSDPLFGLANQPRRHGSEPLYSSIARSLRQKTTNHARGKFFVRAGGSGNDLGELGLITGTPERRQERGERCHLVLTGSGGLVTRTP